MTWAILSVNGKGGTGKSTMAVEIAEELKIRGYDVGLMDADIDSANLASRLGAEKRITFEGDHIVKPVEHNGLKIYSMENAFSESTFAQSGQFFREVIDNMINHSDWGELDYMVVDCPPGSSDVFSEVVRALRPFLKGAISVGQPGAVDDTARLIKVCNHTWVPIIGFVENMSGVVCHGERVTCNGAADISDVFSDKEDDGTHEVEPFGSGDIEAFVDEIGGHFCGDIPLVADDSDITDHDDGTVENAVDAIEDASEPEMPEDNLGDPSFIKNVLGIIDEAISKMNDSYDLSQLQSEYGVEGRDPLVMELKLTDAGPLSSKILDKIVLTVDGGEIKGLTLRKAKRKGYSVEAGMEIDSQNLYDALRGEKKVMRSVTGDVTTVEYSITKAVQMGDASVWGERTVNRLAVLDKILTEVVDLSEVRETVTN